MPWFQALPLGVPGCLRGMGVHGPHFPMGHLHTSQEGERGALNERDLESVLSTGGFGEEKRPSSGTLVSQLI